MEGKCYYCEKEAEVYDCCRCGELTCEDCLTPFTFHNQCDETRCLDCNDAIAMEMSYYHEREESKKKLKKKVNQLAVCIFPDGYEHLEYGESYKIVSGTKNDIFITITLGDKELNVFSERFEIK